MESLVKILSKQTVKMTVEAFLDLLDSIKDRHFTFRLTCVDCGKQFEINDVTYTIKGYTVIFTGNFNIGTFHGKHRFESFDFIETVKVDDPPKWMTFLRNKKFDGPLEFDNDELALALNYKINGGDDLYEVCN